MNQLDPPVRTLPPETEIRIRVEGIGQEQGDEFLGPYVVRLRQPVGDRVVIDDTSDQRRAAAIVGEETLS